jgi:hypothetical protein
MLRLLWALALPTVADAKAWGCCADREASHCDKCRWWTKPGFCTMHSVNCGRCGFSVFCPDPSLTPPPATPSPPPAAALDFISQEGRLLECLHTCREFVIKGVSWYGLEEKYALLQGLELQPMAFLLDFVASNDFNALRIPLAASSVLSDPLASMFGGGVSDHNPAVHNMRSLDLLDLLVREAASRRLLVLLDMHRLSAGDRNNPLWYDARVPESDLIAAWQKLSNQFCGSWNVIGVRAAGSEPTPPADLRACGLARLRTFECAK